MYGLWGEFETQNLNTFLEIYLLWYVFVHTYVSKHP